MRLALAIASRFLLSSKSQSVLIALGIGVGIGVQVFIGSLITGLQVSLIDTTIGNSAHITVTSRNADRTIDDWQELYARVSQNPKYAATSATLTRPGFTVTNNQFETILIRGFQLPQADGIYNLSQALIAGEFRSGEVVIGRELATELNIEPGDEITILTGAGQRSQAVVSGLIDLKVAAINRSWVLMDLSTAQELLKIENLVTAIEIQLPDVFTAREEAERLKTELDEYLRVENWKDQNEQLLTGLQGQSTSSLMIQIFVIIAISLGITSVLAITVMQKSRQIGILKAMGIKDRQASLIFLFQGLMLGILGGILGIAIGLGLAFSFTKFAVNPDGSPLVPLVIVPTFLIGSGLVAIAASILASLAPARRSQKLDPMEVIRNG